jgi:type I restriction enzyme, S subunit
MNAKWNEKADTTPADLSPLAPGWCWATIKAVCQSDRPISYGVLQPGSDCPGGVPLVRVCDVADGMVAVDQLKRIAPSISANYSRTVLQGGEVLLTVVGTIGRTAVAAETVKGANTARAVAVLPISGGIDPKFVELALRDSRMRAHLTRAAHEVARKTLNLEDVRATKIPLAPLNEQRRMVQKIEELFSKLDAGVAALERVKANLKRYRAAVLKAAVEGKLTAEWRAQHPDTEPASKLLDRILKQRRRKWEETEFAKYAAAGKGPPKAWREKYKEPAGPEVQELSPLHKDWGYVTVEQLTERSEYGTSVKCDYGAPGPPVLRIPNIAQGRIDLGDLKRSTDPFVLEQSNALRSGDLLMCRTNGSISLIGKVALVPETLTSLHTFASYLLRFRLVEPNILPRWMHTFISSLPGRRFIERNAASSAGQHNISLSMIHTMVLPLPPTDEQREIVAEVERRLSIVDELEAQVAADLKRAGRLRQSILKRAFAGRLVPQDPSDEPAAKLLERIRASRSNGNEDGNSGSPARSCGKAAKKRRIEAGLQREGKE